MDVFVEQIIRRRHGVKDILLYVAVVLGVLALLALPVFVAQLIPFWIFLAAGACFGAYYLIGSRGWEFEYSITNGDFTCDKIIQRRRRKRQFSLDLKDVEEVGRFSQGKLQGRAFDNMFFVGVTEQGSQDDWYLTGHFANYGAALVVFSPEKRVLDAMKPALKRTVANDAFHRH